MVQKSGFLVGLVFCLVSSCQHELEIIDRPKNLIPADSFELILEELMYVESFVRVKHKNINEFYKPMRASGEALLLKYNIDSLRFFKSMDYYTQSQEELIEMYRSIEARTKERLEGLDTLR